MWLNQFNDMNINNLGLYGILFQLFISRNDHFGLELPISSRII